MNLICAIFDVDGCLSTGQFLYSMSGKKYKTFGPDDALALQKLARQMPVLLVSGDRRGEEITKKRAKDINIPFAFAPSEGRKEWIGNRYPLSQISYMGDSFTDIATAEVCALSLCPADAFYLLRERVDVVCAHDGGHRAVAEAVFHIYKSQGWDWEGDLI